METAKLKYSKGFGPKNEHSVTIIVSGNRLLPYLIQPTKSQGQTNPSRVELVLPSFTQPALFQQKRLTNGSNPNLKVGEMKGDIQVERNGIVQPELLLNHL